MKNRIMRKIAAAGMAVFLVGMSAGSGYMWNDVSVYAAEAGQRKEACIDAGDSMKQSAGTEKPAVREDKETVSEANEMNVMENVTEEIVGTSETVGVESILDEAELPDNALPRIGSEDSEEISDNLFSENENADSFSDSSGDTDTNLQADLSLSVQAEDDTIKAGSDLVYTITAENTGECDLKDLRISYNFSEKGLSGEWSEGAEDAVGNTAYI